MIFPGGKIDYKAITDSFIEDKTFSSMVWDNIAFVERYLPEVEKTFNKINERRIVYRQLAVTVHSCIEAVMKSVLFNINEHCKNRECNKKECKYRICRSIKKLNETSSYRAFHFLIDARMIWFFPREIYEFDILNDLRNNVHISKSIGVDKPFNDFDSEFVEKMVFYFYGLLAQLSFQKAYFNDNHVCLKEKDGDRIEKTEEENKNKNKKYGYFHVASALHILFIGGEMLRNEKWALAKIHKEFGYKDIAISIYYIFAFNSYRFQNYDEYQKTLEEYFEKLSKHVNEDYLNKVRNSYNEIKKQTENKQ